MGVQPDSLLGKIEFAEAHLAPFGTNATAIGLTSAKVTTLTSKTTAARAAYDNKIALANAAKAGTHALHTAVADLSDFMSELIKDIKAAATTNAAVYDLSEIPAPATPAPVPPPGMPTDFRAELLPGGKLNVSFKCANPRGGGTIYQIERNVGGGTGGWSFLGSTGKRSWTDETLPVNSGPVTYRITAVRSTARGVSNEFTVNFGVTSSGEMMATVAPQGGQPPRLAA